MVNMKKAALTRNTRTTLTTHISALIAIKIRSPPSATGAPLPHPTTLELLSVSQRRTSLDHIPTHDCEVVRRAHLGREDTTPPSSACPWPCLWPCLSGCRRTEELSPSAAAHAPCRALPRARRRHARRHARPSRRPTPLLGRPPPPTPRRQAGRRASAWERLLPWAPR